MDEKIDKKFITLALNLARKNLGITAPNPSVGCVIVKNNEIISLGATARGGRPHAEAIAINKISDKSLLNGATLYVTLEPCCHFGKTPPCTDLIIASGIKKVVIATIDPYKKVNGEGIRKLQEARIDVVCGILEKSAKEINKAFFKKQETGLPYVTLKLATSLDGKIATKNFSSKWVTSPQARNFSHYLRAQNDAIMIGANTLRYDNPMLDCRIQGLSDYSPTRIILATNLDLDEKLQVFQSAKKIPTIILTSKDNGLQHQEKINKLKNLGIEIIFCEAKNNHIDLKSALKIIAAHGINSILIEGGKNLATQALQQKLIDEIIWIQNKKIIGEDGISAIGEMGFLQIDDAKNNLERVELQAINEEDFFSRYLLKSNN